ncbi:sialic acid-binding Ig-like lectin 14 [Engystomops pustulosus]|uniref:sialic acid-binding Ig-like lectin 14 n=1 Tax=Engystomops pustulosus TaxID=76066 RepID=UPI003AFAB7BE
MMCRSFCGARIILTIIAVFQLWRVWFDLGPNPSYKKQWGRPMGPLRLWITWTGVTCQVPGYSIIVFPSVSVQEGLCVSIPCTFTANYSNTFTNSTGIWTSTLSEPYDIVASNDKSIAEQKSNFKLIGNPDIGDCTLTISDAKREDEGGYYFRFVDRRNSKMSYTYKEVKTTITMTDLSHKPVILHLDTLMDGVEKTVTCSPPGNCPATSLTFQWRKSNIPGTWRKNASTITFTPMLDDDNTTITCEMSHSKGKMTQRTLPLHVYKKPQILQESQCRKNLSAIYCECLAMANPPASITWSSTGINVTETSGFSIKSSSHGYNTVSRLESTVMSPADLWCTARNTEGLVSQKIPIYGGANKSMSTKDDEKDIYINAEGEKEDGKKEEDVEEGIYANY